MLNSDSCFQHFFLINTLNLKKESLLWKFNRPNESKTHYLLGTMHVSSEEAYAPVTASKHYMEQCQIYAGEMDLNDPDLANIGDYFLNEDNITLNEIIGDKKYSKYKKIISKAYGIDLDQIAHFLPMVISNMISESILTKTYDLALDHFLWNYAMALNMEMNGLESAADQFHIMQSIPLEEQLKALKACIKNVSKFRQKVLKLSELYKNGALSKLYKTSKKSMGGLRKLMIYDRNEHMTQRLIELTSEGAVFCAVGAAHLAGGKGMIRLLKKEGFKIKPIMIRD